MTDAQSLLLNEISAFLTKNEPKLKNDDICNALCENETFLPNSSVMQVFLQEKKNRKIWEKGFLPPSMLHFWKDIIVLLHRKRILDALIFKLLDVMAKEEEEEDKERRMLAASWTSSIVCSFIQLDIAQNACITKNVLRKVEPKKEASTKSSIRDIRKWIHSCYPHLRNVLWLDVSSTVPRFLLDVNFLFTFLSRVNKFSKGLVQPILELISPKIDAETKENLSYIFKTYTLNSEDDSEPVSELFTANDLHEKLIENEIRTHEKENHSENETTDVLVDRVVRNSRWKSSIGNFFLENNIIM